MYYRGSRGVVLCFDLTNKDSFIRVSMWLRELSQHTPSNTRTILVGTKADLANQRQVSTEEAKEFAQHAGIPYIETSARSNINIEEAMKMLVNEIEDAGLTDLPLESQLAVLPAPAPAASYCCNIQ
jgi:small GTP-binding protein